MPENESAEPAGFPDEAMSKAGIEVKIIGVGGAGNNAVDRLQLDNIGNVNLAVVNTDSQVLDTSPLEEKLMIGGNLTRGFGAGGEAEIGSGAALENREELRGMVEGVDLVFLLAGLGGGTGSGCMPVLAELAAREGALVIAFVTLPFTLEGARRQKQAQDSLVALREVCHAVIPLSNDILLQEVDDKATVLEAFALADEWISRGVCSICSMLFETGLINVDFATLKRAFDDRGAKTLFGLGRGSGPDYVNKGIEDLMLCPLLHAPEFSRRADNLIVNITGGPDLTLTKVHEIISVVAEKFGSKDNTLIGAVIDDRMRENVTICVLGTTDFSGRNRYRPHGFLNPKMSLSPPAAPALSKSVASPQPVHASKLGEMEKKKEAQVEFDFFKGVGERGYFDKTERNLYEGEDLDVPAYLRRGIKISL